MTDKELRKLSRSDLLELLISQTEENRVLKSRVDQMQDQLLDRRIAVDKAGSIAEASLQLNGVFQAAEKAAQQYLENIQRMSEEQDTIGRNIRERRLRRLRRSARMPRRSGRRLMPTAGKSMSKRMPTGNRS